MTLTGGIVRNSLTGGILAVAAILAVGCGSHSSVGTGQFAGQVSASHASAAAASTPASAASSPASATQAGAAVNAPPCSTWNLRITLGNGGAAAGTDFTVIDFTNSGAAACTLYGFPGASLTNASDMQIGAAAIRNPASTPAVVTLAPGAEASAELGIGNAENYPAADCKPTAAAQLKVFPPNQTQAIQLRFTATACALASARQLSVSAVTAGPGQRAG